jgi:hypothetical protein
MARPKPNTANWTNVITLATGTNWVEVKAEDDSLNSSPIVTAKYFMRVSSPLTLATNGSGNLTVVQLPPYYPVLRYWE